MDEKKKKPSGKTAEEIFIIIFSLFLGGLLLMRLYNFFAPREGNGVSNSAFEMLTGGPNGWFANFLHFVQVAVNVYIQIATIFSIVVFLAIVWTLYRLHELKVEERKKDMQKVSEVQREELPSLEAQKWQQIQNHVNSQNAAEWRLSILEADVMLDDLLSNRGYFGETLGDKLKNANKGDFKTLDEAWEAHKIRNAIAHEGYDFVLSQRESKRVIGLYEMVFNEFSYI